MTRSETATGRPPSPPEPTVTHLVNTTPAAAAARWLHAHPAPDLV